MLRASGWMNCLGRAGDLNSSRYCSSWIKIWRYVEKGSHDLELLSWFVCEAKTHRHIVLYCTLHTRPNGGFKAWFDQSPRLMAMDSISSIQLATSPFTNTLELLPCKNISGSSLKPSTWKQDLETSERKTYFLKDHRGLGDEWFHFGCLLGYHKHSKAPYRL